MSVSKLKELGKEEFKKQIDPDTSEFECFFHYEDDMLFTSGFVKGYELAMKLNT